LGSFFLFTCPFLCGLEQQISASCQKLFLCIAITKYQRLIFFIVHPCIFYCFCFLVDSIPTMSNAHLLKSVISQFLDMKPVDYHGLWGSSASQFYSLIRPH